ncbi:MAG: hypothetical protein AAGJ46_09555 [Planctomycetota bacterium]
MKPSPDNTERLAQLIRGKRAVLEQLREVGKRQGELVANGEIDALLRLLAAKQRLLTALQAAERGIEPFREQDPESRTWASAERRAACAADADACRSLLAEVMEMERAQEQAMTQRRDNVADQLRRSQAAHNAADAYRTHNRPAAAPAPVAPPTATPQPTALDLSSEG